MAYNPINDTPGTADNAPVGAAKINAMFQELYSGATLGVSLSVTAALAATQNDYAPAGYTPGVTNRLLFGAAAGGSTLTGLGAPPGDGDLVMLRNTSTTDNITFTHLDANSQAANQFSCPGGAPVVLPPLTNTWLVYVVNQWTFA